MRLDTSPESLQRGALAALAVGAAVSVCQLFYRDDVIATLFIGLGWLALTAGQYLKMRRVPLGGRLYGQWQRALAIVSIPFFLIGFFIRHF